MIGSNMAWLSLMAHPQHLGELAGGIGLAEAGEIGSERHGIATAGPDSEVGPSACREIDRERARSPVVSAWVSRHILVAAPLTVRKPAGAECRQLAKAAALIASKSIFGRAFMVDLTKDRLPDRY